MFLASSCGCSCPVHRSHVFSWERRCSWSSADRRCSIYIWVINKFIASWGETYIRGLTVYGAVLHFVKSMRTHRHQFTCIHQLYYAYQQYQWIQNVTEKINTILSCLVLLRLCHRYIVHSCDVFTHVHHGCFIVTRAIMIFGCVLYIQYIESIKSSLLTTPRIYV